MSWPGVTKRGWVTDTEIQEIWRHIARMRKAAGDKDGARRAYRAARCYEGRTKLANQDWYDLYLQGTVWDESSGSRVRKLPVSSLELRYTDR